MMIQKMSLISSAEDESSISVADHYKGTPPLKSKKKKRMSHEVPSDFQVFNSLKISLKSYLHFSCFALILVLFCLFPLKVSKSQSKIIEPKLLPKTNGQICFSILMVQNYLKLEILISSFKYFGTVRIEKQIRPFVFGRSFFRQFCY